KSFSLDHLFLYGPATEDTLQRARQLGLSAQHFSRKEELVRALYDMIKDGDVVLVKGSRGMQMETVVEGLREMLTNCN
ncbi:hypothetical protein JXO59_12315, partial [candidate division KSB1 bacterium]|nr:hypothetical protein [candidate division KSB1 bacterium]